VKKASIGSGACQRAAEPIAMAIILFPGLLKVVGRLDFMFMLAIFAAKNRRMESFNLYEVHLYFSVRSTFLFCGNETYVALVGDKVRYVRDVAGGGADHGGRAAQFV